MVIFVIIAVICSGASLGFMFRVRQLSQGNSIHVVNAINEERAYKKGLVQQLRELYQEMVDVGTCREKTKEIGAAQEQLKAERGRVTITQAELETVETRLRELEEIERELEASGLETKEELNILEKKQRDLANKNQALKDQIETSTEQWDQLIRELESNIQMQTKVQAAKSQLIQTEQKIADLMLNIEQGNEQYFVLKRRYDALDIEYAQLYEKFSESEQMTSAKDRDD